MSRPLRVLIVEDSEDDTQLLLRELHRGGYNPTFEQVETPEAMRAALAREKWNIVISDYSMPHFSGPAALRILQESGQDLPFIIVSGTIGEDIAVQAMKAGAHDYMMKSNLKRLVPAIERELKEAAIRLERKQSDEMIRYMAYYDVLTALPNRSLLQDRLQQAILIGQRENKPVALLIMNLDHFKEINNTLGHQYGDIILQQIGPRVQEVLRESDTVARLGGDEFVILLPATGIEGAIQAAVKILKALEKPFNIEGLPLAVEASLGISVYPDHGANANSLIQRSDVALHLARENGANYAVYESERDQHSPRRLALMGQLRQAIERGELILHYQPKINLQTGHVTGVEALVRWPHPEFGMIPPDHFILPAERTGLVKPLTQWVLNSALRQCHAWHLAGVEMSMAVNISRRNLQDSQLPDQVAETLQICGVAPERLELEITESAIMLDPARAMEILTHLSKMGVRLSIDDFGTGYSSLAALKRLPVNEIKIDKSFVMDMMANENDEVIVRSTIDLAHNLDINVVAEGVESRVLWDKLLTLGCDAAQGYYMGRPLPVADLTRWLHESPWGLKRV
jgi:diguanylate cyclase (GGDEF)-like protein